MRPEFSSISFQDSAKAEINLERLAGKLAPKLMPPVSSLLSQSPDPDGALNLLERYAQNAPPEVLSDLARHPGALTYLIAIFGYSSFLAESFFAQPGLPIQFARDRNFTKLKSREELMQDYARFSTTHPDPWLSSQLARFKRRNYLRIVLKDVLGISTLGETTLELSILADVILSNVLSFCTQELAKRYGHPQYRDAQGRIARSGFSVVSLGKLGGNELNYNSDIDLLFLYEQDGETSGGSGRDSVITNKEYFVRLAHAITRAITQDTPQGQVFRVDLRLRPEGEMGDLAISLKSALQYYARRAREWELQMLIKARHSAGDARVTREFLRATENSIYGDARDLAAIEAVLSSREKISSRLRESRDEAIDVKRHPGGIRDIEFLTQCLQRIHGGADRWVRSGGTLFALRKLNDKGWISDRDYAALVGAYELLRKIEHRIQFDLGQQTHRLPRGASALNRLARRAGIDGHRSRGPVLIQRIEAAFQAVTLIHERLVRPPAAASPDSPYTLEPLIAPLGDQTPRSYDALIGYLSRHAPGIAAAVTNTPVPDRARRNLMRLFGALLASPERFREAREHPESIERALTIAASSEHFTDLLVHHPEDIAALGSVVCPKAPVDGQREIEMDIENVPSVDPFAWASERAFNIREKMSLLRREFRARVIELGASDLAEHGGIFGRLNAWTNLARRSIASSILIAREEMEQDPVMAARRDQPLPFAVLGLGRIGMSEFDLGSDADLLFVVPSGRPQEEIAFWSRFAGKIIEALSSYTSDGTVFAVDTRLRPRGQEGELVSTESALISYIKESAQVWEGFTYLKACPVAGELEPALRSAREVVEAVSERFENDPNLESELQQMRHRLETDQHIHPSDTKTLPGGYYDIDFAISCLRLRHRVRLPACANTPEQIEALRSAGVLADSDALALRDGAVFLRTVDHAVRLVTGRGREGLPAQVGHRESVEWLVRRWGIVPPELTLSEKLHQVQQQVREAYLRITEASRHSAFL